MPAPNNRVKAWQWLTARRQSAPYNADIWHLRHHAGRLLPEIWQRVQDGTYRLSPMLQVIPTGHGRDADGLMMWSTADALVLKWAALTVAPAASTCRAGHTGW